MIIRARKLYRFGGALTLALGIAMAGCQEPTEDETLDVDDFLESSASPNPTNASESTDGRTYRVVRGNNQPDEILPFDWRTAFSVSVQLNNNATSDDVDLQFPVQLTSATVKVQQASGGIVSPPTGGEVEHYDSVTSQVTGNQFNAVNQPLSMVFDVWYDLPSLRREALITVTLAFADDDNTTFTKNVEVRVNP
jgi:hypothetical protein